MYLGKADLNSYNKGIEREYLIGDLASSFSYSTLIGANVRKGHGLLISCKDNSSEIFSYIAKIDESIFISGKSFSLSTNKYIDKIFPDGYRYLQEFYYDLIPNFLYVIHDCFIKKSLFVIPDLAAVVVKYEKLSGVGPVRLRVRPQASHRPLSETNLSSDSLDFNAETNEDMIVHIYGNNADSYVFQTDSLFRNVSESYDNIIYEKDEADGQSFVDSYWSPGYFESVLSDESPVYFVASAKPFNISKNRIIEAESKIKLSLAQDVNNSKTRHPNEIIKDLIIASRSLIVSESSQSGPKVLSGFPSLSERPFNIFMSLPGLLLSSGRISTAKSIIEKWVRASIVNDGILPLSIDQPHSTGLPGSAGLSLIYALGKLFDKSESFDFVYPIWDDVKRIIDSYIYSDERLGLMRRNDGLLYLAEGTRSDWMYELVNDNPSIDRQGALVEDNALFFNALSVMESISRQLGDRKSSSYYAGQIKILLSSFSALFWNSERRCLYDWIDSKSCSADLRPNQILAVSLPFSPLTAEQGTSVVNVCWQLLYTTFGLRSLDPNHSAYRGRFEGRSDQRQKARFRGMSWPWLLGHFISAFMRYYPSRSDLALAFMRPFVSHMSHGCIGGVAEVFDGTMPYNSHGDVLSSLSMAELLRVLDDDLLEFDRL
jgi:predicted glycogen debranching enzyme